MKSNLEKTRLEYIPKTPSYFHSFTKLTPIEMDALEVDPAIAPLFTNLTERRLLEFKPSDEPCAAEMTMGVVFSGGPAAGGHNVVAGVFDALHKIHPASRLIGFIGGPAGIISNNWCLIDEKKIAMIRNQGGFDLLGSGRTKIETEEQLIKCKEACEKNHLNGLLIIGGDDSNTNAAWLAEYFANSGCKTAVIGVPKTIDGDLKNQWIETSFGFDSASKTYSEIIGNISTDAKSQSKYYFFIKVMGRSASHLILECALQTAPNLAIISEEVKDKQMTLAMVVQNISDLVVERAKIGKNFGVILIPEGLIEFIPEFKLMVNELNGKKNASGLSHESSALFHSLPNSLQSQFFLNPDPHGNIQVSKIETERLLIALVEKHLHARGDFKFDAQALFVGYEGRSCLPSNFDCDYCYTLGMTATLLAAHKKSGVMAIVSNLKKSPSEWVCFGVPLISMLKIAIKNGKERAVIQRSLVDLTGAVFQDFESKRDGWRLIDNYLNPGPIQFFGPSSISDRITETLKN